MTGDDTLLKDWYAYLGLTSEASIEEVEQAVSARMSMLEKAEDISSLQQALDYIRANKTHPGSEASHVMARVLNRDREPDTGRSEQDIIQDMIRAAREREPVTGSDLLTNAIGFPVIILIAWLVSRTPLMTLLMGFKIWSHEFGHATVAWFSGYRALPLPIGWTNIEPQKTMVVYVCLAFLIGTFAWSGWKEGKKWPIVLGVLLLIVQNAMTWLLSRHQFEVWTSFAGIGGEFYLNALVMTAFFFRLPEKFRWKACRFVLLFLCAVSFTSSMEFWLNVESGTEDIPFGTLIHGPADEGGDMNQLLYAGWSMNDIIRTYNRLAVSCVAMMGLAYVSAIIHDLLLLSRQPKRSKKNV
jgi:hypothetical protein